MQYEKPKIKCSIPINLERSFRRNTSHYPGIVTSMCRERPFICGKNGCQRRFKTRFNLERHRRLHESEPKYTCNVCGKVFVERSALSHHLRRHNLRNESCMYPSPYPSPPEDPVRDYFTGTKSSESLEAIGFS